MANCQLHILSCDFYFEKTLQTATKMIAKILFNIFFGLRFKTIFSNALFAYMFLSTVDRDKRTCTLDRNSRAPNTWGDAYGDAY